MINLIIFRILWALRGTLAPDGQPVRPTLNPPLNLNKKKVLLHQESRQRIVSHFESRHNQNTQIAVRTNISCIHQMSVPATVFSFLGSKFVLED